MRTNQNECQCKFKTVIVITLSWKTLVRSSSN